MSYVSGTQHYNLPQTVGTDKRDWSDTNQAFADVDAALYQVVETAGDAATAVAALDAQVNGTGGVVERVSAAENDIDTVEGSVATLQTTVANHTSQIADVRRDDQDMITAFNEPDATSDHAYSVGDYFIYNDILYKATASIAVGATIVPNTNCVATNVSSELIQINNDLSKVGQWYRTGAGSETFTGNSWHVSANTLNNLEAGVYIVNVTCTLSVKGSFIFLGIGQSGDNYIEIPDNQGQLEFTKLINSSEPIASLGVNIFGEGTASTYITALRIA